MIYPQQEKFNPEYGLLPAVQILRSGSATSFFLPFCNYETKAMVRYCFKFKIVLVLRNSQSLLAWFFYNRVGVKIYTQLI